LEIHESTGHIGREQLGMSGLALKNATEGDDAIYASVYQLAASERYFPTSRNADNLNIGSTGTLKRFQSTLKELFGDEFVPTPDDDSELLAGGIDLPSQLHSKGHYSELLAYS
jgi:hypothetical protein